MPKLILITTMLVASSVLAGCGDRDVEPESDHLSELEEGQTLIGTYEVKPSESLVFEYSFSEPQWIGFNSNISWDEMQRFKNEEDEFSSVQISQLGTDKFVGSHFGAATVFEPIGNGPNKFEIVNHSRELLAITVYWKPE